ncbi:MAG TPA: hypothetical protein VK519_06170 [Pinirhizobacter sp.]|uniref:hypothetical protein n=1 Tax=Pinirhizobacter sp. TaxID=2950432 RepID=UPI002CFC3A03|nr:hypothetical protein [Pinirhizobacter sp.]HMH67488.1 hypothetical protein [Pinirhizobacter sp.]
MKKRLTLALALVLTAGTALAGPIPTGWFRAGTAPADYELGTDKGDTAGTWNAYIKAKSSAAGGFATMMQTINASNYRGKRVRLSGVLRTQDANKSQLWMRIDGNDKHPVGFDNMDQRPLRDTTGWTHCEIVLDVPAEAVDIAYGFLLDGKGSVFARDFRLEVVGNEVPVTGNIHPVLPLAPVNMGFGP